MSLQGETKGRKTGELPGHMKQISIDDLQPNKEYYIKLDAKTKSQVEAALPWLSFEGGISGIAIGTFVRKWDSFKKASIGMGLSLGLKQVFDCQRKKGSLIGLYDRDQGYGHLENYMYLDSPKPWAQFTNLRKVPGIEAEYSAPILEATFMGENSRNGDIAPLFSYYRHPRMGYTFYEVTKNQITEGAAARNIAKQKLPVINRTGIGRITESYLRGGRKTKRKKQKKKRKTKKRRR